MHKLVRWQSSSRVFLSMVLAGMLAILPVGRAMAFFDAFTIYVFSDVSGVVVMNGEPVQGAEVIRVGDHEHDKVYSDMATTDAQGRFSFGPVSTFSLRPIMLGTIIRQKITIKYLGMEYLAWEMTKRSNHRYGELNDEGEESPVKLDLLCELTEPQDKYTMIEMELRNVGIYGLCSWKGQPKEYK